MSYVIEKCIIFYPHNKLIKRIKIINNIDYDLVSQCELRNEKICNNYCTKALFANKTILYTNE